MSFAHFDVSFLGKSITHTYTPCRLIALQENYLTRFLKRSPQSLLSWSCSLAGCAMQKVFKLNLSFRLCYGFGMGPSLTLQVGIALSGFLLTEKFCNLRVAETSPFQILQGGDLSKSMAWSYGECLGTLVDFFGKLPDVSNRWISDPTNGSEWSLMLHQTWLKEHFI